VTVSLFAPTVVPTNGGFTVQSPAVDPSSVYVSIVCAPVAIRFHVEPPSTDFHCRHPAVEDEPDAAFVTAVSPEISARAFACPGSIVTGTTCPSAVSPPTPSVTVIPYNGVPARSVPAV
jgi:hypothetical protein